jgi:hypothetical protein
VLRVLRHAEEHVGELGSLREGPVHECESFGRRELGGVKHEVLGDDVEIDGSIQRGILHEEQSRVYEVGRDFERRALDWVSDQHGIDKRLDTGFHQVRSFGKVNNGWSSGRPETITTRPTASVVNCRLDGRCIVRLAVPFRSIVLHISEDLPGRPVGDEWGYPVVMDFFVPVCLWALRCPRRECWWGAWGEWENQGIEWRHTAVAMRDWQACMMRFVVGVNMRGVSELGVECGALPCWDGDR